MARAKIYNPVAPCENSLAEIYIQCQFTSKAFGEIQKTFLQHAYITFDDKMLKVKLKVVKPKALYCK